MRESEGVGVCAFGIGIEFLGGSSFLMLSPLTFGLLERFIIVVPIELLDTNAFEPIETISTMLL